MPYATPADPSSSNSATTVTTIPSVRPSHRRTRSSFSEERGPGAFVSLGTLPRRRPSSNGNKKPLFHLNVEDESPPEDLPLDTTVSMGTNGLPTPTNSLRLSIENGRFSPSVSPPSRIELPPMSDARGGVPFPKSSPLSPSAYESPFMPSPPETTSSLTRTPSTPVILHNGKPLKSSLKSSSSSPNVAGDFAGRMGKHLRVQSAPSTPRVHFADKECLESIKVFHRTGKPASLSKPPGDETETETEAESYPFPSLLSSSSSSSSSSPNGGMSQIIHEIDPSAACTSAIPNPSPSPYANVHLETVTLPRTRPPTLRGTVLVRNLAFEKQVAVRFTLDDWQTTSEVICKHVVSLPGLPPPFPSAGHVGDVAAGIAGGEREEDSGRPTWDRFSFTIRLEDYEAKLSDRTLFLVVRYFPVNGSGCEYWDNNTGANYRVGFRRAAPSPLNAPSRPPFTTAYDLPPFTSASNSNLSNLLFNADAVAAMPMSQHAQQRTFSAPSSLRYTPPTGALPAVVSRVAAVGEKTPHAHWTDDKSLFVAMSGEASSSSSGAGAGAEKGAEQSSSTFNRDVEALRGAVPLTRRHSAPYSRRDTPHFPMPPPIAIPRAHPHSPPGQTSPTVVSPAGAYIKRRLSLSNYVAPSVVHPVMGMATPPTTPPKDTKDLPGAEKEKEREGTEKVVSSEETTPTLAHVGSPQQLSPLVMIGGMPATTLEPLTVPRRSPPPSTRRSPPPSESTSTSSCASSSASSSTPTPTPPPIPPAPMLRSTSLDTDETKTPFSPTSRKGPGFRMGSLEAQIGMRLPQQLVSPPVSRQGSEDGSGQSSPAPGSGASSPKRRLSPPRRESPPRVDSSDLGGVFVQDVETSSSPVPYEGAESLISPSEGPVRLPSSGEGLVATSDSSYAAFIRQWCFAQSAPPTPGVINPNASPSASPVPTPSPPIPASMGSLGGMGSLSGLTVGPRRQQAWSAEHQVGVGSGMGLGFPGFNFGHGRRGNSHLAEGVVGAQIR